MATEEGRNDGVVALASARRWPDPVDLPAHHLGLIGQPMRAAPGSGNMAEMLPTASMARLLLDGLAGPERPAAANAGWCGTNWVRA
jgi:hypothetical protein